MEIMFYFSAVFLFICILINISLYIGIFLFNEYYLFYNIVCNIIHPIIIIHFIFIFLKLYRDEIKRPGLINTENKYLGFMRMFPNTDIKTGILLKITNIYFVLTVGIIFLIPMIRDHYEILQDQSVKYQYINRILANGWWFLFLIMPVIYYNDRRKQKNKIDGKVNLLNMAFLHISNVFFSCILCLLLFFVFNEKSFFRPSNITSIFYLFIIPFLFSICPQIVLYKIMAYINNKYKKTIEITAVIIIAVVFSLLFPVLAFGKEYKISEIFLKMYPLYLPTTITGIIYRALCYLIKWHLAL
jgi:hypothetical protein